MHFIREYRVAEPSHCDTIFNALLNLKKNGYGYPGRTYSPDAPEDYDTSSVKQSWDMEACDFAELYPKGPSEIGLDVIYDDLNNRIKPQYFNDIDLHFRGNLFSYSFPHFQLYEPGEGYKVWHVDAMGQKMHRMFVFILYLNDVPDGGTEFRDYNYTCKAEKGKVLFFPANFCFVHRSQVSYTSQKAIFTGWIDCDMPSLLNGGQ
jgi:hypothetical protein